MTQPQRTDHRKVDEYINLNIKNFFKKENGMYQNIHKYWWVFSHYDTELGMNVPLILILK